MEIKYSAQAVKFLAKLDYIIRERIQAAITDLPNGDIKKLQGRAGYRMRVGDYRILFDRVKVTLFTFKKLEVVAKYINRGGFLWTI